MVKVIDGEYFMISTKRSLLQGFLYKVSVMHNFKFKFNPLSRTMTLKSEADAGRCSEKLCMASGVELKRHGRKIKVRVPTKLILHIE